VKGGEGRIGIGGRGYFLFSESVKSRFMVLIQVQLSTWPQPVRRGKAQGEESREGGRREGQVPKGRIKT